MRVFTRCVSDLFCKLLFYLLYAVCLPSVILQDKIPFLVMLSRFVLLISLCTTFLEVNENMQFLSVFQR